MMMHQAKVVFTGLIIYSSIFCYGQKEIKTYYDRAKKRVEEHYFVSNENQAMEGKYKRYFPNGKLALEGTFVNGVRSGTFYEYHENGTLIRKINYADGLRHGSVEVFTERGEVL
ncbi:MAG: toxin-antitoxin system YwqK family antitoxin, partial [Cytophagales bacterium]